VGYFPNGLVASFFWSLPAAAWRLLARCHALVFVSDARRSVYASCLGGYPKQGKIRWNGGRKACCRGFGTYRDRRTDWMIALIAVTAKAAASIAAALAPEHLVAALIFAAIVALPDDAL